MRRKRNQPFRVAALGLFGVVVWAAMRVPSGIGPGPDELPTPHLGIAVKTFDSRWIPVNLPHPDILEALRELRLETSTMWFRIDCGDSVYDRRQIGLVYQGGTVWVAAGHPKPTAPPAACLEAANGRP